MTIAGRVEEDVGFGGNSGGGFGGCDGDEELAEAGGFDEVAGSEGGVNGGFSGGDDDGGGGDDDDHDDDNENDHDLDTQDLVTGAMKRLPSGEVTVTLRPSDIAEDQVVENFMSKGC